MTEKIVDVAVVGAGIAGLSAAVFLGRAGRSTIVYDGGRPRIFAVDKIREYTGFDGETPATVLSRAREEALAYGVSIRTELVKRIEPREDGLFDVWAATRTTARTVVLATGLTDEVPELQGLSKVWGNDLRVCPCFDGYEVRDQRFVVFGLPDRLAHMGSWVSMWSPHVTVVSRGTIDPEGRERLRKLGVSIVPDEVIALLHEGDRLVGVTTESGSTIPCDATWIAMRHKATSALAASLCDVDEHGIVKSPDGCRTSRPGVYAVGNSSDAWAHMVQASAAGTRVGPMVTMYLLESMIANKGTSPHQRER